MKFPILPCLLGLALLSSHAFGETADQPPGQRFQIKPGDLPPPNENESVGNMAAKTSRPATGALRLLPGFKADLVADRLNGPRYLEIMPNDDILVSETGYGKITGLRQPPGADHATVRFTFASGLERPHGIAFHDGYVYVGDTRAIWRYKWNPVDGSAGPAEQVTPDDALGNGNGNHFTRNIIFAPDGRHFFVSIGSHSNDSDDPSPYATIKMFDVTGGPGEVFAHGLRNPVGMRFYPGTDTLWTVVNERDGLGNNLVPDYLTHVEQGGFYGWPYSYIGQHRQPGPVGALHPDLVATAIVPDLLFQAHSASLGLLFYEGAQFPKEYQGDAFVTLHGSWNAQPPTGYKIVHIKFHDGMPEPGYENFVTGFWVKGDNPAEVWGRPVGLAEDHEGRLLFSDDVGQSIWRVSWVGK